MHGRPIKAFVFLTYLIFSSGSLYAQSPAYGDNISLNQAREVAAAAIAEAKRQQFRMAVAIVDTGGHLVYFERLDDTQTASVDVAIAKAKSANNFRRPTKTFEDVVNGGRTSVLGLPGAVPIEGGLPILVGGKIIGAIGVSGASSQEDGVVADAGVRVLK